MADRGTDGYFPEPIVYGNRRQNPPVFIAATFVLPFFAIFFRLATECE